MVDRYDQYRVTIKSIRNIEASVQPSRDREYPQPIHCLLFTYVTCPRRQTENHRSDRPAQVQRAKQPPHRGSRTGACPCRSRVPGRGSPAVQHHPREAKGSVYLSVRRAQRT